MCIMKTLALLLFVLESFGASAGSLEANGKVAQLRAHAAAGSPTPSPLEGAGRNAEVVALRSRAVSASARATAAGVRTRMANDAADAAEKAATASTEGVDVAQYTLAGATKAAKRSSDEALSEAESAEVAVAEAQREADKEATIATSVSIEDVKTRLSPVFTELQNWKAAEMAKRIPPPPRGPWQLTPDPLPFQAVQAPPAILLPPGSPLANPTLRAQAAQQGMPPPPMR